MKNTSDILIKVQNYGMLSDETEAEILECDVAGLYYNITHAIWDKIDEDTILYLVRDYKNQHDYNAISVNFLDDEDKKLHAIGYIPKEKNEQLAALMDMGWGDILGCRVSEMSDDYNSQKSIKLSVFIKNISEFKKTFITETYRAAYIDEFDLEEIKSSLLKDGYVYFRWGGFPPQNHNFPNIKEKVFFIYRSDEVAEIYLMSVVARGDKCLPFFNNPDELDMVDDCSPFILTNIKGPVNVDIKKVEFLEDEDIFSNMPETFLSDEAAQKLKMLVGI